jgi:hypothetical protein
MERDSFDQALRAFKGRVPFRPFTVALANGDRYEVDFPDALTARNGVAVYHGPNRVLVIFDCASVARMSGDLRPPGEAGGGEGLPG